MFFLLISNHINSQELHIQDFREYIDSLETEIKNSSDNYKSDLKHFRRWLSIAESRLDDSYSLDTWVNVKDNFAQKKSGKLKSTSIDDVNWGFFGPTGIPSTPSGYHRGTTGKGWIYNIWVDPFEHDTIIAGTRSAGAWKTTNHGNVWSPFSDEYAEIFGVNSIAKVGNTIIISSAYENGPWGGYYKGLFRSTDGGNTWNSVNNGYLNNIYPTNDYKNCPRKLYAVSYTHLTLPTKRIV